METVTHFIESLYSSDGLKHLIATGGLWLLIAIVFSETGLLVGFFLPGDSLLVTAGVIAASMTRNGEPVLNVWEVNFGLIAAAFVGDQLNYYMGRRTGMAIFDRGDSRFFKKKYAQEAHDFYLQHGGKAIVIARFLPILRTFVPFIAGVATMPYRRYLAFSIFGSSLWVTSLVWLGYKIGQTPLGKQLHYVILLVVGISFIPIFLGILNRYLAFKRKQAEAAKTAPETASKAP